MGIQTWEGLQKNSTNDETIEQAIARLIAVHEADSNSHLGVGESLQAHKNADVIDHPMDSVVPDKINSYQKFNFPVLLNSSVDIPDNCFVGSGAITFQVYQDTSNSGEGSVFLFNFDVSDYGYTDGDIVVDFRLVLSGSAGTKQGRYEFGFAGVELKSGYYRFLWYTTSWQYSSWFSDTLNWKKHFRVLYSKIDQTIYFYLNQEIIFSINVVAVFDGGLMGHFVFINRGSSNSATVYLDNVSYYIESTI
jgi:hypothetical protein